MYYPTAAERSDRRLETRVRMDMFLNQYVKDRSYRSLAVNLSHTGLYVQKLKEPIVRHSRVVGLEFELPGTRELIWASAEPRFDSIGQDFHVTGLRFLAMARKHERLIHDYLIEKRRRDQRWLCHRHLRPEIEN